MLEGRSREAITSATSPRSDEPLPAGPGFVVAIPVKDEERHLLACLAALARQHDRSGRSISPTRIRIVVFANNCTDQSASIARNLARVLSLNIRVVEEEFPPTAAHAGAARRVAMDMAEAWLMEACDPTGVILTTDADSQVAADWIAENLAAFELGADAVLGRIDLDDDGKLLPAALHRRGELEDAYEKLLTELSWLLDPLAHNPWPHHATISGATLGITRSAYCRVGRLPRVPLGEDKALVDLLSRADARIRYCPTVHVITSGRTKGRAPGGVADTLAIRSREPEAFCDEALEPFRIAFARAAWRACLRRRYGAGRLVLDQDWAKRLEISPREVDDLIHESAFGAIWAAIENRSPLFARRSLRPAELPEQISIARRWLAHLREGGSGARQHIQPEFSISISSIDDVSRSDPLDKESGGLVAA
jgi:GT2 family glycosyltransferase